jgi:hypothetical protein
MKIVDDRWWESDNTPAERQTVSDLLRDDRDILEMLGL